MYLATKRQIVNQEYIVLAVAILAALFLIVGSYKIMLRPTFTKLSLAGKKIKKGKVVVPDAQGYRKQYSKLEDEISDLQEKIVQSKEKLFWKKDITIFLKELTYIAEELAVDFISIKPGESLEAIKAEDGETVLMFRNPIDINIVAGYAELISFLGRIEKSEKFLRIDKVNITINTKNIFKRNVSIALSIFSAD